MNTRELFKRRVIELIHGLPYEEALEMEREDDELYQETVYSEYWVSQDARNRYIESYSGFNITIWRVMQATSNVSYKKGMDDGVCDGIPWEMQADCFESYIISEEIENFRKILFAKWRLTKENGEECTDNDQTDETIESLYNLIKE